MPKAFDGFNSALPLRVSHKDPENYKRSEYLPDPRLEENHRLTGDALFHLPLRRRHLRGKDLHDDGQVEIPRQESSTTLMIRRGIVQQVSI